MKKYIVVIIIVLFVSFTCSIFEIPDRLSYAVNKMGGYDMEKYNVNSKKVSDKCELELDFSKYTGNEIVLLQKDNGIKVVLTKIDYTGNGYKLYIQSVGVSTFENANIIAFEQNSDCIVESNYGNLNLQLCGESSYHKNSIIYTFDIYSSNENQDLSELKCKIKFDNMILKQYIRRNNGSVKCI